MTMSQTLLPTSGPAYLSLSAVEHKPFRHFLVHYDGSLASLMALDSALDLLGPDTRITTVAFIVVPPSQPLDLQLPNQETQARVVLAGAVANATTRGIRIQTEIIKCHSIAPAAVAVAADIGADVVFWTVERSELGQFDPLASYILRFSRSQVIIFTA